jgi:ABC-type transport system involved in cytochrome c biogenesis permease subunit
MERDGAQRMDFDYVSYARVVEHGKELEQERMRVAKIDKKQQTPEDRQLMDLYAGAASYLALNDWLEPLRHPFAVTGDQLRQVYGGKDTVSLAELLRGGRALADFVRAHDKPEDPALGNALQIGQTLKDLMDNGSYLTPFPPDVTGEPSETWYGFGDLVQLGLRGQLSPALLGMLDGLQGAVNAPDDAQRGEQIRTLHRLVTAGAAARGEAASAALESKYYAWSLHYQSLHYGFVMAFLCVVLMWFAPRARWPWWGAMAFTTVGLVLLAGDVVLRCIVRDRPPITGLYDTFLFIGSVGVLVALIIETINRRRVAVSVAPIFGGLIVLLARMFEVENGQDTMAPLMAVLDSNYWLATHVTSINTGYAAGMVAALLGTTWLVLGALGVRKDDAAFHKSIVRMTYGATCFGLIFAVVGTILGGVWANDSWGRFWGWDTKENGALLICISQVALLHARMSGLVRDFGFCVCAALTGCVVAFSWFGVNQLQVGLHSYGFSDAIGTSLNIYYGVQLGLVSLGVTGRLLRDRPAPAPAVMEAAAK